MSAFCFLLPRIIIEAKLVEVGFLSRGEPQYSLNSHRCLKLLSTMMSVNVDETFESHTY